MKTLGLWEAAKRGAMAQLVDLEIERAVLEKLIAKCDSQIGVRRTEVHRTEKATASEKPRKTYNGRHWTQRPENRAKVMKLVRRAQRARRTT